MFQMITPVIYLEQLFANTLTDLPQQACLEGVMTIAIYQTICSSSDDMAVTQLMIQLPLH